MTISIKEKPVKTSFYLPKEVHDQMKQTSKQTGMKLSTIARMALMNLDYEKLKTL